MIKMVWLVSGVLVGSVVAAASVSDEAVNFRPLSFEAALEAAGKESKIVFVDVFTTWCGPCKELDRTTWRDRGVAELLSEKAVALKIDAEREPAFAKRYKIDAYPTLLLLKSDGSELDRLVGFRPAAQFIEEFNSGITGTNALMRAEERAANASKTKQEILVVQARLDLGRELARKDHNEAALKQFLWCYDEGMPTVPAFQGVRNSFLLSDIANLGKHFPPALAALRERRDRAETAFKTSTDVNRAAWDLVAINRTLGEADRTVQLYDALPARDEKKRLLAVELFDRFVELRRYADAASAKPFDKMVSELEMIHGQLPQMDAAAQAGWFGEYLVKATSLNIEVLLGSDQRDSAKVLAGKSLSIKNTVENRAALHEAAVRAGCPDFLL